MKMISCPNCGERPPTEFSYGGELHSRPSSEDGVQQWINYYYFRRNKAGVQTEWWYHGTGCKRWFLAERDTISNEIARTYYN